MSHKAQKQDMHGQQSKGKWIKDNLLAPVKDLLHKPGSRTPSPSPQSALADPSGSLITDTPATSAQGPLISTQGPAVITATEGSVSPLITSEGADVALGMANQGGIGSGNSKESNTAPLKAMPEAIPSSEMGN
ncbi:hypothetical protein C0993_000602 [Termitomyces sp. T159_Od127]|nr:hypothetical protein C0993_000602 [Termitomyces sp. T159_Od127]